ncbi:hypothetical protein BGX34_006282 [Mortierella sp. NVP85]|nr:hypothetical protein BGX34_006282 [Mortierella sp. NVP85]
MSWAPSNDTLGRRPPWNGDDEDSRRWDPDHASKWSRTWMPATTYLVATCYLTFLCIVAVIMCLRNRTRLRVHACFITYLGLTIAVIGLLRAKFMLSPAWFWAWNFTGEGLGVVVLALTIASVGSGFYPMVARNRNVYWRISMGVIIVYGMVALATVAHYAYHKIVFRPLTGDEVQKLRDEILNKGILTQRQLLHQRWSEQNRNLIPPGDAAKTGVKDWRELAWAEKEMFARPTTEFYLGHQVSMLLTCMCAVLFLFIPLVRQHRHGPIGRHVDGDMMAVGVWYLSTLMTLAFAYAILNMYYCINNEYIHKQQAQALDLCLRITIGPIFFLPAPGFLLRFYRERFQRMKGNNGSGRRNGGSSNNQANGSFTNSAVGNNSTSQEGTQVGSRLGTTGHSSVTRCSYDLKHDTNPKFQDPTSPVGTYGRFKLFHSRDRGTSVESSRALTKDFECESHDSHQPSEGHRSSFQMCQNSIALENINSDREKKVLRSFNPLQGEKARCGTDTLKQPEPALTEQHLQAERNGLAYSWMGNQGQKSAGNSALNTEKADEADEQLDLITGSTACETDELQVVSIHDGQKFLNETSKTVQDSQQPSKTPFEHLTGLQRQLAEHRSALLPKVLAYQAYHEDLASGEPFECKLKPVNPYDTSAQRHEANEAKTMGSSSRAGNHVGNNLFKAEPKSTTHLVDPNHWSLSPASPQTWAEAEETMNCVTPSNSFTTGGSKPRENKSKDGLIAVFSKALNSSKDKGGNTKDSGQTSQLRTNHDIKDRSLKNGSNHGDSTFEINSAPIAPTVEELTQLSAREHQGESSTSYDYDPYDDQPGFNRFRDSIRPGQQLPTTRTGYHRRLNA